MRQAPTPTPKKSHQSPTPKMVDQSKAGSAKRGRGGNVLAPLQLPKTSSVGMTRTNSPLRDSHDALDALSDQPERFRIRVGRKIGAGAQGDVYQAVLYYALQDRPGNLTFPCVVKCIKNSVNSEIIPLEFKAHKEVTDAISAAESSSDSGVLRFIGTMNAEINGREQLCAVLPMCDSTLAACLPFITDPKNSAMFENVVTAFFASMLKGLSHFSEKNLAHRDLKPDNILLRNGTFRIADFGCAQKQKDIKGSPVQGTPLYIAPEFLTQEADSPSAADIWSLGQILLQIFGEPVIFPLDGEKEPALYLFRKGSALQEAQKKRPENFDAVEHQAKLRKDIKKQPTYKACGLYVARAMVEMLSDHRASLDTLLKCALQRFGELTPKVNTLELNLFVIDMAIQAEKLTLPLNPSLKVDSQVKRQPISAVAGTLQTEFFIENTGVLAQPLSALPTAVLLTPPPPFAGAASRFFSPPPAESSLRAVTKKGSENVARRLLPTSTHEKAIVFRQKRPFR